MGVLPFQRGIVAITGLLIAGCQTESPKSEPAAPDVPESPAGTVNAARAQTFHFKSRGPFAQATFFIVEGEDAVLFGFVDVMRTGVKADQQTLLFYTVERCPITSACTVLEQGSGVIPNRDLVVRTRETTLHTNTAANPGLERFVGSGGLISLRWTQNSAFVTDFHGHSRTRIAGVLMERSQFASSSSSAFVEGTVFGTAVSVDNSGGTVGTVRSGTLVVQKGP